MVSKTFFFFVFTCVHVLFGLTRSTKKHTKIQDTIPTGDFLYYDSLDNKPYNVTYDDRSFIINGERTLLLGGSIHYPRLSPGQWNDILSKARNDGLNHVEIYVFWNLHEPTYDFSGNHTYSFEGRANLTGFIQAAANNGLFVNLRIGPYVCAEWSFGGLPIWLLHVPDILFRDANEAWENEMKIFVDYIGKLVTPYLAKNGGPIILAQIENEYHGSMEYVNWCGELALSQNFDIPWVMCNGESANNTVNTCNGNDCYASYVPSHSTNYPNQPLGWTENEGWFQYWEVSNSEEYVSNKTGWANRSPENMAYVIATWFASGACHHNYYMWYGGNHIEWTAGSGITNYYADGVNYHADGIVNEPKRSHLMKLHNILAQKQKGLLQDTKQYGNEIYIDGNANKNKTFAYVYNGINEEDRVVFLVNLDVTKDYTLDWEGISYDVPSESVSILDYEGEELYNTGKVDETNLPTKRTYKTIYSGQDLRFYSWNEEIPLTNNPQNRSDKPKTYNIPQEQIRYTNNTSEYLYYSTKITTNFGNENSDPLIITFTGRSSNAYNIWFNNIYVNTVWNGKHNVQTPIRFNINLNSTITNKIDCSTSSNNCILTILSSCLGINNLMQNQKGSSSQDMKGITGDVLLYDNSSNKLIDNYTNIGWDHWIGSTGENLNVTGSSNVSWSDPPSTSEPMTWYRTYFVTPTIEEQVFVSDTTITGVFLLDIGADGLGFQRGHFWLNGIDMGHYNNVIQPNGYMMQQYYFIPIDYLLEPSDNGLNVLIFEEELPFKGSNDIKNMNLVYSTVVIP